MALTLVTGASRGIGLEVARALAQDGRAVRQCVRDPSSAPDLPGTARELLDVADPASIAALAERLSRAGERVELLVNNAGVYEAPAAEVWATNLRGPALLVQALEGYFTVGAVIVNVSSGLGALSHQTEDLRARLQDPALTVERLLALAAAHPGGYGASKAALNAFTRLLAAEGAHANSVDPGWVRTRMGGPGAPRSLAQGAASVLHACRLGDRGPWGTFLRDGRAVPW